MNRYLITGAAGFIGQRLREYLRFQVTKFGRCYTGLKRGVGSCPLLRVSEPLPYDPMEGGGLPGLADT